MSTVIIRDEESIFDTVITVDVTPVFNGNCPERFDIINGHTPGEEIFIDGMKFDIVTDVKFCGHSRTPSMAESNAICAELDEQHRKYSHFAQDVNRQVMKKVELAA